MSLLLSSVNSISQLDSRVGASGSFELRRGAFSKKSFTSTGVARISYETNITWTHAGGSSKATIRLYVQVPYKAGDPRPEPWADKQLVKALSGFLAFGKSKWPLSLHFHHTNVHPLPNNTPAASIPLLGDVACSFMGLIRNTLCPPRGLGMDHIHLRYDVELARGPAAPAVIVSVVLLRLPNESEPNAEAKLFQPGTLASFEALFYGLGMEDISDRPVLSVKNVHGGAASDFEFEPSPLLQVPLTPSPKIKQEKQIPLPGHQGPVQQSLLKSTGQPTKPSRAFPAVTTASSGAGSSTGPGTLQGATRPLKIDSKPSLFFLRGGEAGSSEQSLGSSASVSEDDLSE